ncbi:unnamed protein product [Timema podura]|uniref:EGF-like calcium-binding domain-containing protein n=1 Tax=Timema podura TaxID=61482 RepID=A0ABN7NWB3_TIMPD|nr:unnamed protein product [Timema podura]
MTQCPAGYKINKEQKKCEDVDECKENLHSCMDETEICRNNIGAYECDTKCKAGFLYDNELRSCVEASFYKTLFWSMAGENGFFVLGGSVSTVGSQRSRIHYV